MIYLIPAGIDRIILARAIRLRLLRFNTWEFVYDGITPTAVNFDPDLDTVEQGIWENILIYVASLSGLETLPEWANWTYQQAETHITGAILNGKTLEEVNLDIERLPVTVAGMKTGLHQTAAALIETRTMLVAMAKAIIYVRDLTAALRD